MWVWVWVWVCLHKDVCWITCRSLSHSWNPLCMFVNADDLVYFNPDANKKDSLGRVKRSIGLRKIANEVRTITLVTLFVS